MDMEFGILHVWNGIPSSITYIQFIFFFGGYIFRSIYIWLKLKIYIYINYENIINVIIVMNQACMITDHRHMMRWDEKWKSSFVQMQLIPPFKFDV